MCLLSSTQGCACSRRARLRPYRCWVAQEVAGSLAMGTLLDWWAQRSRVGGLQLLRPQGYVPSAYPPSPDLTYL